MKLPWWSYILVGLLVSGFSGYMYRLTSVPGKPNNPMALFFFIGIIFLIVGVTKFLFVRLDARPGTVLEKPETARQAAATQQHLHAHHGQHRNSYAQSHEYKGPVHHGQAQQAHSPQTHAHASHAATHQQSSTTQTAAPRTPTIVSCKKCNTKNYDHSFYCHMCGNRLR